MSQSPTFSRRTTMKMVAGAFAAPALIRADIVNAAELDRSIGRLMMVGFSGRSAKGRFARTIASHISKGRASSVIYLGANIGSRRDVVGLNKLFHNADATHIAIDHEGGVVQRLKKKQGFTRIPSALELARKRDITDVEKVYDICARELAKAGFTLNLGPVVDLHRSFNPVIGKNKRAYSSDAVTVAKYAAAFVRAHHNHQLRTSLKHFPGHGLSRKDSHHGFVDIRDSWRNMELEPFKLMIKAGLADIVMSGHLFTRVSEADNGELATFSRTLLEKVLREQFRFDGPVMTDDLDMGAVRKVAKPREAAIRAVEAGYDLLLLSNSLKPDPDLPAEAVGWIRSAIKEGRIQEAQIFRSANRIDQSRFA